MEQHAAEMGSRQEKQVARSDLPLHAAKTSSNPVPMVQGEQPSNLRRCLLLLPGPIQKLTAICLPVHSWLLELLFGHFEPLTPETAARKQRKLFDISFVHL